VLIAVNELANGEVLKFLVDHVLDEIVDHFANDVFEESADLIANRRVAIFHQLGLWSALNFDPVLAQVGFALDQMRRRLSVVGSGQLSRGVDLDVGDGRFVGAAADGVGPLLLELPDARGRNLAAEESGSNAIRRDQLVFGGGELGFGNARRADVEHAVAGVEFQVDQAGEFQSTADQGRSVGVDGIDGFVGQVDSGARVAPLAVGERVEPRSWCGRLEKRGRGRLGGNGRLENGEGDRE